ncbi:MAG: thiolase family protein [Desulfobacterota bacterium]|nr:thiolase family protein [Thermodesulfobacteriota bacterium]
MQNVVIVSACRTPIGDFLGTLKDTHPRELGKIVGQHALRRAGIEPDAVDELVCGNVIQAGVGGNLARQIQAELGIPWSSPACTVNQLCASAMRALEIGCHNIMLGKTSTCLAIGVESMSGAPYLLMKARQGYRMGSATVEDAMLLDALVCSIEHYHMGMTAENVALRYHISREEQDDIGVLSQQRATAAIAMGKFKDEIVPVELQQKKGMMIFNTDEHPRPGTTKEILGGLKTVFKKDGTVTAGNASGVNDGAAAAVLMSETHARELGIAPLARVVATVSMGVEPSHMGLGPAVAVPAVLKRAGLHWREIGCWELHEAFAAQFLGVMRKLKDEHGIEPDMEIVNRNGSGIALGHPVGCTGLRIVVTLIHEMRKMGVRLGCASLCAGGGPAMACIIENLH